MSMQQLILKCYNAMLPLNDVGETEEIPTFQSWILASG